MKGVARCAVLERSLWLRVEENGVEAGRQRKRLWTESGEDDVWSQSPGNSNRLT